MKPPILRFSSLGRAAVVAALALGSAVAFAPVGRAEDGEGGEGPEGLEKQIREQMDKIVKLMRENEKAILEASLGSGKKPAGAAVEKPEAPEGPSMAEPKPDGGGEGAPPGARGDDIKKRMEELIRATQDGGGSIPSELEELVKMIPTRSGGGGGGGGDPSEGQPGGKKHDLPDPDDPMTKKDPTSGDPKSAEKKGEKPNPDGSPPKSETGEPSNPSEPPWFAELPEQQRKAIIAGNEEDLPARLRPFIGRYRKWLLSHDADTERK